MKLYFARGACSLTVRIIIHEIGLNSEFVAVDLKTKCTEQGDDYLKINPKGAVPALQLDNGQVLTENGVIIQYLADTHHATQLLPKIGDFNRYRVLEWLNYIATELHKSCGLLFNPNFSEEVQNKMIKPLIKTKASFVDKQLGEHNYLLGDHFTLPDAYLFLIINWLFYFKFDVNEWPNLSRYHAELKKRPSIHESLKEEGFIKVQA